MPGGDPLGPLVVSVRGPSRSGKTTLCEALVRELSGRARVGWCKRTHHGLDLPHKSSGRVWTAGAAAMAVSSADRLQVTLPPVPREDAHALVAALPPGLDIVLFESHTPEPFPAFLAEEYPAPRDEQVLGRFTLDRIPDLAPGWADLLLDISSAAVRRRCCGHGHVITVRRPGAGPAFAAQEDLAWH